ncbi:Adenine deaminase [Dyadobacter sp. CECT 9275]|uniref:Adenine deaminase n=1 Tax=Dyadobacter helix TaxID=2822344 RepID=A0A916JBG2_9BACT|nr:amidohydrolase family protein [Dyadobacter sp. CECT 9275]CAG4998609.1 Adenine deaminase [Dyadobacter sp. CECT 9275]
MKNTLLLAILFCLPQLSHAQTPSKTLLKGCTLIDGTGASAKPNTDILLIGDRIAGIGKNLAARGATVVDLQGKTVMPALISAHVHVGTLKGTGSSAENYTRENIINQLVRYQDYGITHVLVMGTDRPLIFNGLRDSTVAGLLPGARLYSAGYGFNTPDKNPGSWMNLLLRPESAEEVPALIDSVAKVKPTVLKMWVDDHGGKAQKMKTEVYTAIISEAHKRGIRVAAHLFNVADADALVDAGLDIIAHSIRDAVVGPSLLAKLKAKGVIYIPTLSLDEYAVIYTENPEWINEPFFKASLEPGVYEMLTSKSYQESVRNSPDFKRNSEAAQTALVNLKKIHDAGITVALGTDSGAFAVRTQGFTEHHELELMVRAGLTPLRALTAATQNAAKALKIEQDYGTIAIGKKADIVILGKNPENNIRNTRTIEAIWKDGKPVSKGPLAR